MKPNASIENAFIRVIGRKPNNKEIGILESYYLEELSRFEKNMEGAISVTKVGESPISDDLISPHLAALAQVITAIYNLEEAITKI